MSDLELKASSIVDGKVDLGKVDIGVKDRDSVPVQLVLTNTASSAIRDVQVGLQGDGATAVRLATDADGAPGVWAAVGESIMAYEGELLSKMECRFWAQAVGSDDLDLGSKDFSFVVKTTQV
jgi:hypothetical protein